MRSIAKVDESYVALDVAGLRELLLADAALVGYRVEVRYLDVAHQLVDARGSERTDGTSELSGRLIGAYLPVARVGS